MKKTSLTLATAAALLLGACGGTSAAPDTTSNAPTPGGIDLTADCPSTVVIQTDWNPEAEHGFLYNLLGNDYEVDTDKVAVRGTLMASGKSTGVRVEIRAGGPAIGFQRPIAAMYTDPDIMLGFVSTDEAINFSADKPTMSVVAPFVKNPQVIMWDPATYPEVKEIKDLKEHEVKVIYRDGLSFMDYFLQAGILDAKELDGTYDGTAAAFVAAGGKKAQQGFSTSEPYYYEKVLKDWMKPVAYQYVHDAGWTAYAQSLGGTPENITKWSACLKKLVPVIQQSQVDYVNSPDAANAVILDAVNTYNNGWLYDAGQATAAAAMMKQDGVVANSPDGTLGSFDLDRVTQFISTATPVFLATGSKPKKGLTAADLVTNEYVDPAISLG